MQELARTIVSRLRAFIGNRRRARRHSVRLPVSVTPSDRRISSNGSGRVRWMEGHTSDVSATGMSVVVPAIRIGEHYLVGHDRRLHLRLDLPMGPLQMEVKPVRYESLEEDEVECGYVIGVTIIAVDENSEAAYADFVQRLVSLAPLD